MDGLTMKYFVLKPRSKFKDDPYAKASRESLKAYANTIREENPKLCAELKIWVNNEQHRESEKDFL